MGSRDAWGRPQSWNYDERFERFEEVEDSEDGAFNGVGLDRSFETKRFASDELRFTGIDLGSGRARQRRSEHAPDGYTDFSESEEYGVGSDTRLLILKEKEDLLVEQALERIARARALGKTNVKLSRTEIDALERAEQRNRPTAALPALKPASRTKKAAPSKSRAVAQRKGSKGAKAASDSPKVKAIEPAKRERGGTLGRDDALVPYPISAEDEYGYYGLPRQDTRRSQHQSARSSRAPSSHRQVSLASQPMPYHQHPYFQGRYYSNPDVMQQYRPPSNSSRTSRPDPSNPDWEPRARSTSSLVNYPIDQLPNPTQTSRAPRFDPNDPRYASPPPRRVVSGPNEMPPQMSRRHSDEMFVPDQEADSPASTEGSSSRERATSEEEDEDAEDGQGVQVEVTEESDGDYVVQTRSQAARKAPAKSRTGGSSRRKGR